MVGGLGQCWLLGQEALAEMGGRTAESYHPVKATMHRDKLGRTQGRSKAQMVDSGGC